MFQLIAHTHKVKFFKNLAPVEPKLEAKPLLEPELEATPLSSEPKINTRPILMAIPLLLSTAAGLAIIITMSALAYKVKTNLHLKIKKCRINGS
jgi:hypothetical protein